MEKVDIDIMKRNIQILDCTLRDGGFSLEDAEKNDIPHMDFSEDKIRTIAECLAASQIDIVELGAIEKTPNDMRKFAIYPTIEEISCTIPQMQGEQLYAVFFRGPDISLDEIPDYREGLCNIARMCLRYSELEKSLDYCRGLKDKGYKVFIQPMVTMRYTQEELDMIIETANEIDAYALYFVDSYGCMQSDDVESLFLYFDQKLKSGIRIGFHAHNNMNLAFANVLRFIELSNDRAIVIDACCMGMGQGAGNMQSEILAPYLNEKYGSGYNVKAVLQVCDELEGFRGPCLWGYSPLTLIPAIFRTAYKYAIVLREKYGYKYAQIYDMLKILPSELRHRYTIDNVKLLIERYSDSISTEDK